MKNKYIRLTVIMLLISATCISFTSCMKNKEEPRTKISDEDTSETVGTDTLTYTKEENGLTLKVMVPKEIPYGERFKCVAEITNNTDSVVNYTIPNCDENAHLQIAVEIGTKEQKFIDCDTFGKAYDCALMDLELKPHETYTQEMTFLPGYWTGSGNFENLDEAEIVYFPAGEYKGEAAFFWNTESSKFYRDENISLEFTVKIAENKSLTDKTETVNPNSEVPVETSTQAGSTNLFANTQVPEDILTSTPRFDKKDFHTDIFMTLDKQKYGVKDTIKVEIENKSGEEIAFGIAFIILGEGNEMIHDETGIPLLAHIVENDGVHKANVDLSGYKLEKNHRYKLVLQIGEKWVGADFETVNK